MSSIPGLQPTLRAGRYRLSPAMVLIAIAALIAGCGDDDPSARGSMPAGTSTGEVIRHGLATREAGALHRIAQSGEVAAESAQDYWKGRLASGPKRFAIDFIQGGQLEAGNGSELALAEFPLLITGQIADQNAATGPGHDAMRPLQTIDSAYLTDASGNRLYVTDEWGTRAFFDPRSRDVREALLNAVSAVMQLYPYDGIFLDHFGIADAMVLDTKGKQYVGSPGQVISETDREGKLEALQAMAAELRRTWPNALIVANDDPVIVRDIAAATRFCPVRIRCRADGPIRWISLLHEGNTRQRVS
ncbi:MAG: hypothetical protein WAU48_10590 [Gammaproteobacteria bacterium]